MASKKYTCGADGYYQTKVWDGTYDQNGRKHRITLRSNKSSRDLERQELCEEYRYIVHRLFPKLAECV